MSAYSIVKQTHSGFAYLSILLFVIRGALMLADKNELLAKKPLKILPHVIDTVLLVCAFSLLLMGGMALPSQWLAAKFIGMIAYVGLGFVALKLGKTKAVRAGAFAGALVVVLYLVKVAKTKIVF
jgi:uncharacterized membrane protein SirB2